MAFADAKEYVTDPKCMNMPVDDLISVDYGKQRASQIGHLALPPRVDKPHGSVQSICAQQIKMAIWFHIFNQTIWDLVVALS